MSDLPKADDRNLDLLCISHVVNFEYCSALNNQEYGFSQEKIASLIALNFFGSFPSLVDDCDFSTSVGINSLESFSPLHSSFSLKN